MYEQEKENLIIEILELVNIYIEECGNDNTHPNLYEKILINIYNKHLRNYLLDNGQKYLWIAKDVKSEEEICYYIFPRSKKVMELIGNFNKGSIIK